MGLGRWWYSGVGYVVEVSLDVPRGVRLDVRC